MPLLGIFSRKKSRNAEDTTSTVDHDSPSISPTAEYVTPDKSLPSSPNGKNIYHNTVYPSLATSSGESNKLRIPFARKSSTSGSVSSVATDKPAIPARLSFTSNTSSNVDHAPETRNRTPRSQQRPPPSKSAIFAAYADPHSALSTRSLPTVPKAPTELPSSPPLPSAPPAKRSFFGWTKGKSKTVSEPPKISPPPSLPNIVPSQEQDSFNLRAFRHLSPPSPEDPLPSPRARPRIDSFASDSSQRISVAAFREAQSKRSLAGSPVPSFRSPSPGPLGSNSHLPRTANDSPRVSRSGSPPRSTPRQNSSPQIRQPPLPRSVAPRRSTAPTLSVVSSSARTVSLAIETSSEESSEEEESEDDMGAGAKVVRQRTITKGNADARTRAGGMNPAKAKSESGHGHGFGNWRPGERAHSTFELLGGPASAGAKTNPIKPDVIPPRSQSSLGTYGTSRASASASALAHSANKAGAHVAVSSNVASVAGSSTAPAARTHTLNRSASSSSSDSEDDAPLATLVGPKRPGSSLSNASGSRAQVGSTSSSSSHAKPQQNPRKPLIDISALTASGKPSPAGGLGFTGGATLLAAGGNPGPQPPKFSTPPPVKFVSPPTSDASSEEEDATKKTSIFQRKTVSPPVKRSIMSSPASAKESQSQSETSPSTSRKNTASPPLSSKSASPPPRKEGISGINFSERLSKVVQQNVGKSPKGAKGDTDLADQMGPGVNKPTRVHHRRVSSDQTIAWRETAETIFPGTNGNGRAADNPKGAEPHRSLEGEKKDKAEHIVPTPIRQRDPPSSFSVTSRPRQHPEPSPPQPRPRSTTLLSPPTPSAALNGNGNANGNANSSGSNERAPNPRQRSTTMVPHSTSAPNGPQMMPAKPFAERRESPASSTGGSSSGRVPLTPRDGSDLGGAKSDWGSSRDSAWGSGVSGKEKVPKKKPSVVSFEDEGEVRGRERRLDEKEGAGQGDNRRNERRRTEAKAAIELGNVINGPGPNLDDEDGEDNDVPLNQAMGARMGMMNPRMMPMGFAAPPISTPGWNNAWQQQQQQLPGSPMLSPAQFMIPAPADPNFFAAHQQAMLIAKQAYQMAVAQQALAAAGEEWERGSNVGGFGGSMSMYGNTGPAALPVPGLGMMGGGWLPQPGYGGAARSEYGGARSEYGAGWGSSRSVYGESFGPSGDRARARRGTGAAVPPLPERGSGNGYGSGGGNGYTSAREGKGRARTASVPNPPVSPQRASFGGKKVVPPSSWKSGAT